MSLKGQEIKWVNKGNVYASVSALLKMLGFWWKSAKSALKMWLFIQVPDSQWRIVGVQDCFSEKCSVCLLHSCLLANGSYSVCKSSNRAIQGTWESKAELEENSDTAYIIGQCYVCRHSIDEVFCFCCMCFLEHLRICIFQCSTFLNCPSQHHISLKVNSWCKTCTFFFSPSLWFFCSLNILCFVFGEYSWPGLF